MSVPITAPLGMPHLGQRENCSEKRRPLNRQKLFSVLYVYPLVN